MFSTSPPQLPPSPDAQRENGASDEVKRRGAVEAEQNGMGVYLHFPWCLAKCPYCDFLSIPVTSTEPGRLVPGDRSVREVRAALPHERYALAVRSELAHRVREIERRPLVSIFIGGGTPSLWSVESLRPTIAAVLDAFGARAQDVEITAEANPSSLDPNQIEAFAALGVNRLSIGVQSLNAERLKFLGRLHSPGEAEMAVRAGLQSSISRVSADMIYGVAGQAPREAVDEIAQIAELGVKHLSAYTLTIEPNTRFGELSRRGQLPLLNDALVGDSYLAVSELLERLGFEHYEISNFARAGERSVHNLGYWRGNDYLGLGVGAVGTVTLQADGMRHRYKNALNVERYMAAAEALDGPTSQPLEASHELIDGATAVSEALLLGLRTTEGVDLSLEAERRGVDPWTRERSRAVRRLEALGRLRVRGTRLSIPKQHWIVADGIIRDLI